MVDHCEADDPAPSRAAFDPADHVNELTEIALVGTADRLEDFVFRVHGSRMSQQFGEERNRKRFSEIEAFENFDEVMDGYWRVYKTGSTITSPKGSFPAIACMRATRVCLCPCWDRTPQAPSTRSSSWPGSPFSRSCPAGPPTKFNCIYRHSSRHSSNDSPCFGLARQGANLIRWVRPMVATLADGWTRVAETWRTDKRATRPMRVTVGGGAIGSSIAFFPAEDPGFDGTVTVIERDPTYAQALPGPAGLRQQLQPGEWRSVFSAGHSSKNCQSA